MTGEVVADPLNAVLAGVYAHIAHSTRSTRRVETAQM